MYVFDIRYVCLRFPWVTGIKTPFTTVINDYFSMYLFFNSWFSIAGRVWGNDISLDQQEIKTFYISIRTEKSFKFLDYSDEETIKEAASVIAKHTCIRFVERKDDKDYIEFYEDSK